MILNVYAYFNKIIAAFDTKMQFDDHDDKQVVYGVQRGLTANLVLGKYEQLKYLQLYKLGTFDDEKGEFVADKVMLLDFDNVIASYEAKQVKEVQADVGKEAEQSA